MNKIFAFLVLVPLIALLLFKAVSISEYDTKQRYLKDQVDLVCYQVKVTGRLIAEEYDNFVGKLNKLADFSQPGCITIKKGTYVDGTVGNLTDYTPGELLNKGDAFLIYVKSSNVSSYSRIQNGGISPDDSNNLYYKAKGQCRVEAYR